MHNIAHDHDFLKQCLAEYVYLFANQKKFAIMILYNVFMSVFTIYLDDPRHIIEIKALNI